MLSRKTTWLAVHFRRKTDAKSVIAYYVFEIVTVRAQKLLLLNIFEFCFIMFKRRFLNGLQHFKNIHCSKGINCSKVLINLLGMFFFPHLKSGAVLLWLSVLCVLQQRWNFCFTFHNRLEYLPQELQIKYDDVVFWEIFIIVQLPKNPSKSIKIMKIKIRINVITLCLTQHSGTSCSVDNELEISKKACFPSGLLSLQPSSIVILMPPIFSDAT